MAKANSHPPKLPNPARKRHSYRLASEQKPGPKPRTRYVVTLVELPHDCFWRVMDTQAYITLMTIHGSIANASDLCYQLITSLDPGVSSKGQSTANCDSTS